MTTLRLVAGVVVLAHGSRAFDRIDDWTATLARLGVSSPETVAPVSVAGALFVGTALVLGWLTRLSALSLFCVSLLAVASLRVHGLFAGDGGFEYPLVLAAIAVVLFATGGGRRLSLDQLLLERARRKAILRDELWQHPPYVPAPPDAVRRRAASGLRVGSYE
jgi:putative oxidoreductase